MKRGRQKADRTRPGEVRESVVRLRVTAREARSWRVQATRRGLSVSEWIRMVCGGQLAPNKTRIKKAKDDREGLTT